MPLSKWFYWLFCGSLLILFLLLGYGELLTYRAEDKNLQATIENTVQNTAQKVQSDNYFAYDLYKVVTDPEYKERVAFAAGITQNQSRMSISFDSDANNASRPPTPKKKKDSLTLTIFPANSKPVTYNYSLKKPKKTHGDSSSFFIRATPTKQGTTYTINPHDTGGQQSMPAIKKIQYFHSILDSTLKTEKLDIPYHIEKVTKRLQPERWATGVFIINFYAPDMYRVVYKIPGVLMIKRLMPYTAVAILLLTLVAGAFLLYRKSYRMQLQMAQFKESLFSNVTHELKTPLSSLQLIVKALQDDNAGLTEKQKEYLDFESRELQRMHLLIEKILSFGKLNEEQFALNTEIINLNELINAAIDTMNITAGNKNAEISFEPEGNYDIFGDSILLLNMLISIIDNAIKYTTAKPVIHIALQLGKNEVVIKIKDNGPGINPRYLSKIFEPFFRAPTANEHSVKGHGLGLSFASQVAVLHSGKIHAESEPGQGSSFIITIPT